MKSQNRFNIKYGCVAERSKAPDSRYLILTNENWEHSGIARCKSSNLFATIIFWLFFQLFFFLLLQNSCLVVVVVVESRILYARGIRGDYRTS